MATYQVAQADIDQLEALSAANDFLGYYSKLSALGDRYANLATGVAAADTALFMGAKIHPHADLRARQPAPSMATSPFR